MLDLDSNIGYFDENNALHTLSYIVNGARDIPTAIKEVARYEANLKEAITNRQNKIEADKTKNTEEVNGQDILKAIMRDMSCQSYEGQNYEGQNYER